MITRNISNSNFTGHFPFSLATTPSIFLDFLLTMAWLGQHSCTLKYQAVNNFQLYMNMFFLTCYCTQQQEDSPDGQHLYKVKNIIEFHYVYFFQKSAISVIPQKQNGLILLSWA